METLLRRTPLYDIHVEAGARMVPFGGWEMPVQYTSIVGEHRAVRAAVGLFDVSHMGEFEVEGPEALAALQDATTNDVGALEVGQVQYSLLCYPDGGVVDDLTLYRLGPERFMMTVNAANIDKDWAWVTEKSATRRSSRRRPADRARRARHPASRDALRALRQRHRPDHQPPRGGAGLGGEARQGRVRRPESHRAGEGRGAAPPAGRPGDGRSRRGPP